MFIGLPSLWLGAKGNGVSSPPFTPSSLATLTGWLDPSNTASLQQSSVSGGAVGTQGDLVGKATSPSQATAVMTTGDATRFVWNNTAGAFLSAGSTGLASDSGGGSTTAFFFIAAFKLTGGFVNTLWSDHTSANANAGYEVFYDGNTDHMKLSVGNGTVRTVAEALTTINFTTGGPWVVMAWDDGVNLNCQVNNNAVASVARPTPTAGNLTPTVWAQDTAGTQQMAANNWGVIWAKNNALTAPQRAQVKTWLGAKAGLSL